MTPQLKGNCNRCGRCCVVYIEGRRFYCQHLRFDADSMIGLPKTAACAVYKQRYNGMPISLIEPHSRLGASGKCGLNSQEEVDSILERGIGRGCSLEVVYG